MLMADAEGFWKSPNLYDAVGVVGFVVGIASIWFSWWLAKRDISKKVNEAKVAAERAIRRVAATLFHLDLAEVAQSARIAREACVGRQWLRAKEKLSDCRGLLNRISGQEQIVGSSRNDLIHCIDTILYLVIEIDAMPRTGAGTLSPDALVSLDDLVSTIMRIDGRLRNTLWESEREL